MNKLDSQLKDLYNKILERPNFKSDRTNTSTKSIFGHQIRLNVNDGFPLTTLRKIHTKSLIHELLWFLSSYDDKYKKFGNTNIRYLVENGVNFWTDWCYKEYKEQKFKKWQADDLDGNRVKTFKLLSMKEFTKKIISDDNFALKYGDLGRVYGAQWLDFGGSDQMVEKNNQYKETKTNISIVDKMGWDKMHLDGINQIDSCIDLLISDPDSRRILVNSWKADEIDDMLLAPCHLMFQFYTEVMNIEERIERCNKNIDINDLKKYMSKLNIKDWNDITRNPLKQIKILDHFNIPERKLSLMFYMRSNDVGLGINYNIASYALLLHMFAQVVNMEPYELIYTGVDVHIYSNHIEQIKELLTREPRELPKIKINKEITDIYDFRYEDFEIVDYDPHPNIKMDVAV